MSDTFKRQLKCFFGMHNYQVIAKMDFEGDGFIKRIYISRCPHCGKIKTTRVRTDGLF